MESWKIVTKEKKVKFSVVSLDGCLPNNAVQSVNSRHVPGTSLNTQAFNIFRKAAVLKLQRNRKLDNLEEALALNCIMLASYPKIYSLRVPEQTVGRIEIEDIVTEEDIETAKMIVEEIVKAIELG